VIAARLDVDIAGRQHQDAQGGHAEGQIVGEYSKYDANATQTNNGSRPADNDQTQDTIGLQFTLPIFSGGITQSQVRQQVHLHRVPESALMALCARRSVRHATLSRRDRRKGARRSAAAGREIQPDRARGYRGRVHVGTRTTVDVLDAGGAWRGNAISRAAGTIT
jgi:outer membrane protein